MRSNKELLDIFLNNQNLFKYGICQWTSVLKWKALITIEEESYLLKLVKENRPIFRFKNYFYNPDKINEGYKPDYYYWKSGFINPRIKWLKKYLK